MATDKIYRSEKTVKAEIKRLLLARDWFVWMPPANGFGKIGVSDFHALRSGVFMAVEAKFGPNKATPHQKGFLETINACQAFGVVVSDQTINTFEMFLDLFDQSIAFTSKGAQVPDELGAGMLNALAVLTAPIVAK